MIYDMKVRNFALNTILCYLKQVRYFAPRQLTETLSVLGPFLKFPGARFP